MTHNYGSADVQSIESLLQQYKTYKLGDDNECLVWKKGNKKKSRVTNPLFVLPVDDFDLNPVRCLELLRLLRSIAVPRLFTLILGDIDQAEEVLQLKMTGDFAGIMDAETVR